MSHEYSEIRRQEQKMYESNIMEKARETAKLFHKSIKGRLVENK